MGLTKGISKLPSGETTGIFLDPYDKMDSTPIWRVESPSDLAKDRSQVDVNDLSNPNGIGSYAPKTAFIVEMYKLGFLSDVQVSNGIRIAARLEAMLTGLNPKTVAKAKKCAVTVKRVDTKNLRWIFSVNAGNGPKAVKIKASRARNVVKLALMDLSATCSCQAWQWTGPEFHAKGKDYLDGSPRGTASTPDVKDPERQNVVCKHVAAVLSFIKKWEVPLK